MTAMTSEGKKNHLAVALFLAAFGALLTIATFFDLEVSRIMTHFSLKEGAYYTNDLFANFFEAVGMLPRYLLRAFAALSVGWFLFKAFPKKSLRILSLVVASGLAVYLLAGAFSDMILYPMKHMIAEDAEKALRTISQMKPTIYAISYVLSAASVGLTLYLTRNVPLDPCISLNLISSLYFTQSNQLPP